MRKLLKRLLCFHPSWASCGWRVKSARQNWNWHICKSCGKQRNFGFRFTVHGLAMENIPINYDCTYEVWDFPKGEL